MGSTIATVEALRIQNSSATQSTPTLTVRRRFSRLHTDGRWIKDNEGNIVRLVGASVFWRWQYTEAYGKPPFDPLGYTDETAQKYDVYQQSGANFLRVQLNKWLWDNAHDTYVRAVDTLVSWCAQRGIMVVLTFQGWHVDLSGSYRDWTQQEQVDYIVNGTTRLFMQTLATRYRNETAVIGFEIMPEIPTDSFWASYRNESPAQARAEYRQGLISAIRTIHAIDENYLVFVYPSNGDQLTEFIQEAPIGEKNVVYCIMRSVSWDRGYWSYADAYYAGNPQKGSTLMEGSYQSWLFDALDLGYPAMLMETEATVDLPNPTTYVDNLLVLFEKHRASVAWWSFDRQETQDSQGTNGWLFLLQDGQNGKLVLTEVGLVWAEHMKEA
jgi:hypothetical protein